VTPDNQKPQNLDQKNRNGLFLVIEGTDGSGKGTQSDLLVKRLIKEGYDVELFDFPQYELNSSYFVKEYLNGKYGTANDIGPYAGSLFYALDRFEASFKIRQALKENKIVVANRFTGSNMAHQGTKFKHAEERRGYYIWLDNLEFEILSIPRPDRSIVLRVPAQIAQKLVDTKSQRTYTDKKRDIHEADINHLEKSVLVYDELCSLFPKDFTRIDCVRNDNMMNIDEIHHQLWATVQAMLPEKTNQGVAKLNTKAIKNNEYLKKTKQGWKITNAGETFLQRCVTDTADNVYAFNDGLSPMTIAAAMARLSRRGDDMRITILDEFAAHAGKDEKLLQRVITAYGDDSVQQLVGIHMVVENASNLLTKKLEWGRLASYLEQSTRYIYFDEKDTEGKYKYYIPDTFDVKTKKSYVQAMDAIFSTYSAMVRQLTDYVRSNSKIPPAERDGAFLGATRAQACDAVRHVLPVATKSTVGIFASGQAIESLIMHLQSDDLNEANVTGVKILNEARKVIPTFLERADRPDRGGAAIAYRAHTSQALGTFAQQSLQDNHAAESEDVTLVSCWPKNELDIAADMLYEYSNQPLKSIQSEISSWPIDKKQALFNTFFGERLNRRHKPGRALEKVHYSWDIVCDYGIFRDLQRHRIVDDLNWQKLTPRYGYDIPQLIEDAGLTDMYQTCFDISLKLHSFLQSAGYENESQYATLLGHKMRWKVTYNAREAFHFHELRTSPQGHPGYRKLVQKMHEKVSEVHPLIASAMTFVNQGEDEELTRLAAEKYTQFKLDKLSNSRSK
jgi:thymidylate kinase/thymidylate synthase ThyX